MVSVVSEPGIAYTELTGDSSVVKSMVTRLPSHALSVAVIVWVSVVAAVMVRSVRHVAPTPIGSVGRGIEFWNA